MSKRSTLRILCFLMGFFSLGAQTLLFREHLLAYSGNELGAGVFLAAWMVWIGAGALSAAFIKQPSPRAVGLVCLLYPFALLVQLNLLWHLRALAGLSVLQQFDLDALILWTALACCPVSWLTGFSFAICAALARPILAHPRLSTAVQVYGLEALGAVSAGLLMTLGLYLGIEVALLLSGLGIAWALGVVFFGWRFGQWTVVWGAAATGLALLLFSLLFQFAPGAWTESIGRLREPAVPLSDASSIVSQLDTPYQHLSMVRTGSSLAVYSDGELVAGLPDHLNAQLAAVQVYAVAPQARRILVVGLSSWQLLCSLTEKPGVELSYVTVDSRFDREVRRHLPAEYDKCTDSSRVEVLYEDPLHFVRSAPQQAYDLVMMEVGHPRTVQVARFYTVEFHRLVKAVLAPGGTFTVSARGGENALLRAEATYLATVYKTLSVVFPNVKLTATDPVRFFARSGTPDFPEEGQLHRNLADSSQFYPLVEKEDLVHSFDAPRSEALRQAFESPGLGLVSSADSPAVFLQGLEVEQGHGVAIELIRRFRGPGSFALGWLGLAFLAALVLWGRGSPPAPRGLVSAAIAAGGFVGMSAQTALLLSFQAVHGALWAQFGLLNALFMLGLAMGGLILGRIAVRHATALSGAALVAACAVVGGLLSAWTSPGQWVFWLSSVLLGLAAGWFVSSAAGVIERQASVSDAAVSLEAWDHLGAAAGAIVGGLVLLPYDGPVGTLALGGWLVTLSVLALYLGGRRRGASGNGRTAVPSTARAVLLGGIILALLFGLTLPKDSRVLEGTGPQVSGLSIESDLVQRSSTSEALQSSWDYAVEHAAWGGRIEVLFQLDDAGVLSAVRLGRNRETPEYIWGIQDWLDTFPGKAPLHLVYGAGDRPNGVDGLTGATVTGEAIVRILRSVAHMEGGEGTAELGVSQLPASPFSDWWTLLGMAFLMLSGVVLYGRGVQSLYPYFLLVVAALAGVVWNAQFAIDSMVQPLQGALPPASNGVSWLLLVGVATTLLLFGPLYCGTFCPAGAVSELLARLGLRIWPGDKLDRGLRQLRFVLAVAVLAACAAGASRSLLRGDVLSFLFFPRKDLLAWSIAGVFLAGSILFYRPYCRYVCPVGAMLSLGERLAVLNPWVPVRQPGYCHLNVRPGHDLDCIRCNRCVGQSMPKRRTWRMAGPLLVAWLVTLLCLWGLRVAEGPPAVASVEQLRPAAGTPENRHGTAKEQAPVAAEVFSQPDRPSENSSPRLLRKDDDPHSEQRQLAPGSVGEKVDRGEYSGHEALFYLPVPEN